MRYSFIPFVPIILWCLPIKLPEFPAKIGGAFKAGFLCDPANVFFSGSEQLCCLFQTKLNQVSDWRLMNSLLEYLYPEKNTVSNS